MTEGTAERSRSSEWSLMNALHDAFRRDLDELLATSADHATARARWIVFRDQLHFHHTAEDQAMWPPARAKLAGNPAGLALLDAMEDEHKLVDPLVAAIDNAFALDSGQASVRTAPGCGSP